MLLLGLSLYYLVFIYPIDSLASKLGYSALEKLFDKRLSLADAAFALIALFPLLGRLLYQLTHSVFSRHLMALAMTWAGFLFFLLWPVLLLDLVNSILAFDPYTLAMISLALVSISVCLAVYGIINANLLFVKTVPVKDSRLSQKSTAIQLSDVHIGSRSSFFIKKLVQKVNALNADKVFITGDLVDLSCVGQKDLSVLKQIKAPVYFVTGNHDRYVRLERLLPMLEQQDFIILRNTKVELDEFDLIGIDDAENPKQVQKQLPNIPVNKKRFTILLYHRPQGFDAAAEHGVNLMLSGHTHNGQIIPFNLLVKRIFKDIKGSIQRNGAHLHVSTGTSTWGPIMRIGSTNEITLLHFEPLKAPEGEA